MARQYPDFRTLSRHERQGVDFRILVRRAAPVGRRGAPRRGIEPGTSEIADAVAALELSFDAFEGLKPRGDADPHHERALRQPMCLSLIGQSGSTHHPRRTQRGRWRGRVRRRPGHEARSPPRHRPEVGFPSAVMRIPACKVWNPPTCATGERPVGACNWRFLGVFVHNVRLAVARGPQAPDRRFRAFVAALRSVLA